MRRTLWLLLWVAAGCRGPVAAVPGHASVAYVEARENEAGVAGAPVDETDFEFEPEPSTPAEPEITGVPEGLAEAMLERVRPWMGLGRVRVSSFTPDGLLVVTRTEGTSRRTSWWATRSCRARSKPNR